ncbi:GNAT family N-acetyltransferase [Haloferacaceae archaeon DSL9]
MNITSATGSDLEWLVDWWVALARDQRRHGSHLCAATNRTRIRETMAHQIAGGSVYVARTPDPAGFVMFHLEEGSFAQDVVRGVVSNIYVAPDARSRGVGSALLAAAEEALADAGAEIVTLDALAANDAARRFYARHGYTRHRIELEKRVESDKTKRKKS